MTKLQVVSALVVVILVGLANLRSRTRRMKRKKEFASNFLSKFKQYVKSGGKDRDAYTWLIHRSSKMQVQSGASGRIKCYPQPSLGYAYPNYPVILILLPHLDELFQNGLHIYGSSLLSEDISLIDNTLVRHIGVLDDQLEILAGNLRNPIIWLREGTQLLLTLPITALNWVGVISPGTSERITASAIVQIPGGLITLIYLVGSIMTIALGWQSFTQLLKRTLGFQ